MIPELGHWALILALFLSLSLAILPMLGSYNGQVRLMVSARSLAMGQGLMLVLAYGCLTWAFVQDDFTVRYVAANSNSALPVYYKISAVWGGHEGSLLLWVLMLGGWIVAVSIFAKSLPMLVLARVLSVLGMVSVGFLLFTLFTSNPFLRYLPRGVVDGADLNPLLQDFGLIVHPPTLYMGYVGLAVGFAFAIATLLSGKIDSAWLRWARPWVIVAWSFLTLGIALGSWWAYYELGWGGFWFWDPVENASLMPWLIATALMHSLAVSEKRGLYQSWSILLAILAFSMSLLGTFLVRSGVLTSVHSFAADPQRGVFLLVLLGITVGGGLTVYALRVAVVRNQVEYSLWSRETFLLINNMLLVVTTLVILLGTLYPLIVDVMGWNKVSIGPPYYNSVILPFTILLVVSLGLGMVSKWKSTPKHDFLRVLQPSVVLTLLLSLIAGVSLPYVLTGQINAYVTLASILMTWLLVASGIDLQRRMQHQGWKSGLIKLKPGYYGMLLAHIGLGMIILGVAVVTQFEQKYDLRMAPGDQLQTAHYTFLLRDITQVQGPNYVALQANMLVSRPGQADFVLQPQKRTYTVTRQIMTEAAINSALTGDIYVAMGEPLDNAGTWAMRIYIKPLIRFIWLGAIMMALGGVLAVWDKRYRRVRVAKASNAFN